MKIKTRFSPSPTGCLHVGSIRTAFYSWLFTRQNNGKFILRIEDTDIERSNPEAINEIIESMNWLNLNWDEGPYFQTQRYDRYNEVINNMLIDGTAYKCFCSKKRLDILRKKQIKNIEKPRYDSYCRDNKFNYTNNKPYVVRFRNPKEGSVIFHDKIHGLIKFNNQELDDLIIRRTNGLPTYNFCVVIDDWDMKISHIIRGTDHINNTPRQINILKALGAPIPEYAHISMILSNNGKKLSKRCGALGIMYYRNEGYLPQALLNYLMCLGWSYGNKEIFSFDEMKKYFKLDMINKSANIFDIKKLQWFNHKYINSLSIEEIIVYLTWHINKLGIEINNGPKLKDVITLLSTRCKTLKEMAKFCYYFYKDFIQFDINSAKKYLNLFSYELLKIIKNKLFIIKLWTLKNIHNVIKDTINELNVDISKVNMPLRIAMIGIEQSPSMDIMIYLIGKERSLKRIDIALSYILKNKI
ncbi:Glutamate--tRNA ligase [Serratia symbiotica]|nr:Glutamate--tRNA ligase [Serratia symbiotica]